MPIPPSRGPICLVPGIIRYSRETCPAHGKFHAKSKLASKAAEEQHRKEGAWTWPRLALWESGT